MRVKQMILPRSGFQSSVNLAYDLASAEKVRDFVPTEATLRVIEELVLATTPHATERAHILIGAYGKGKSHAVLILLSLLAKQHGKELSKTLAAIDAYRPEFGAYLREQVLGKKAAPMLPVIVDGTQKDLAQAFLLALRRTLVAAHLTSLLPETPYQAAVRQIRRWQKEFPATYAALEERLDVSMETFLSRLAAFDGASYRTFLMAYPALTAGSMFEPYADADVVELYAAAAQAVSAHGYRGLYVVYDEFGKYLESQIETAGVSETRLLQDFAERAGRSGAAQLHLLLITHKDIANYLGRLPKWKIDGWRGVSERFVHVEMHESFAEAYELIGRVIEKDATQFAAFEDMHAQEFQMLAERTDALHVLADARAPEATIPACYPLHPLTVYLLPRLSELVAQNERTLFTFLARDSRFTLRDFLRRTKESSDTFPLLLPDTLFDYFEPTFRQEAYTSPVSLIYRRALQALSKTGEALPKRLLKTVALLEMTSQGAGLVPTADLLVFAYEQVMDGRRVLDAFHMLTEGKYLLHESPGTGAVTIKEASGVDVRQKCRDRAERLRAAKPLVTVLNELVLDVYLYPAKYNDDLEMTRYFSFQFLTGEAFLVQTDFEAGFAEHVADGIVYALLPNSVEEAEAVRLRLQTSLPQATRCLFILPHAFQDIAAAAYDDLAATALGAEASEDATLREEYRLIREDARTILTDFLRTYLEPGRDSADYFHAGRKLAIHRRAQLSRALSNICAQVYSETPVINNETLNRNVLTPASQRTREHVIEALLHPVLAPDLGQKGVSQGMAFVRSVLLHTGILTQDGNEVHLQIAGLADERMERVMRLLDAFFQKADGGADASFHCIYEKLQSPKEHIAMKRGPIPILLAAALRPYRGQMTILGPDGREMEPTVDLFRAIEAHPEQYRARREHWNAEKQSYVETLSDLFAASVLPAERAQGGISFLTKAMQRWYLSLPNYTRQTKDVTKLAQAFRKSLQRPYLNAHAYLFEKLPRIFSVETLSDTAAELAKAKASLDGAKTCLIKHLERQLVSLFGDHAQEETSLGSALADWREGLSEEVRQHVFSGTAQAMLTVLLAPPANAIETVETLARAVLGLRLNDWDDAKESRFLAAIRAGKEEVEAYEAQTSEKVAVPATVGVEDFQRDDYLLTYVDADGSVQKKAFDRIIVSPRAKLLRNEIDDAIETMGGALSREEKRQVLVEVLQAFL